MENKEAPSKEFVEDLMEKLFKCYNCGKKTDRYIRFNTIHGEIEDFECKDCRQERVQAQIDMGLRPKSDLLEENFPENR